MGNKKIFRKDVFVYHLEPGKAEEALQKKREGLLLVNVKTQEIADFLNECLDIGLYETEFKIFVRSFKDYRFSFFFGWYKSEDNGSNQKKYFDLDSWLDEIMECCELLDRKEIRDLFIDKIIYFTELTKANKEFDRIRAVQKLRQAYLKFQDLPSPIKKIQWKGTQKELAELLIELKRKGWIEDYENIAIKHCFSNSNTIEQYLKPYTMKDKNGYVDTYEKVFTPKYKPRFFGIKPNPKS